MGILITVIPVETIMAIPEVEPAITITDTIINNSNMETMGSRSTSRNHKKIPEWAVVFAWVSSRVVVCVVV